MTCHQTPYPIIYKTQICSARTFGFLNQVDNLRKQGLALGGSLDNAVVLDDHKVVNSEGLRFSDEFVRHKVLDFIGDIYLLGYRVLGSFEIFKGGHRLTHELAKSIMSDKSNWKLVNENADFEKLSFSTLNQKKELSASF